MSRSVADVVRDSIWKMKAVSVSRDKLLNVCNELADEMMKHDFYPTMVGMEKKIADGTFENVSKTIPIDSLNNCIHQMRYFKEAFTLLKEEFPTEHRFSALEKRYAAVIQHTVAVVKKIENHEI